MLRLSLAWLLVWLLLVASADANPVWVSHFTDPLPDQDLNGPRWERTTSSSGPNFFYWNFYGPEKDYIGAWWQVFGDWDPKTVDVYPGGDITIVSEVVGVKSKYTHDDNLVVESSLISTAYHNGKPLVPLVDLPGEIVEIFGSVPTPAGDLEHTFYIFWQTIFSIGNYDKIYYDPEQLIISAISGYLPPGRTDDAPTEPPNFIPNGLNTQDGVLRFHNVTFTYYPNGLPTVPEPSSFALAFAGLTIFARFVHGTRRRALTGENRNRVRAGRT